MSDAGVEELDLIEADDIDFVDAVGLEEFDFEAVGCWSYDGGVVGVGAVRRDGRAMVAEIDVRFEAGDALPGDAGSLEAANELFRFAREHGSGDDFDPARGGCCHWAMVMGSVVDFWGLIIWRDRVAFCAGLEKDTLRKRGFFGW